MKFTQTERIGVNLNDFFQNRVINKTPPGDRLIYNVGHNVLFNKRENKPTGNSILDKISYSLGTIHTIGYFT